MKSVVALEYSCAKNLLEQDNYQVQTRYVRPPRQLVGLGNQRVIGQRRINNKCIELVISHEDYQPEFKK